MIEADGKLDHGLTLTLGGTLLRQKWDDFNEVNEHYVLMQSTGLFDKNKKEIFEGDVVNVHRSNPEGTNPFVATIIWDAKYAWYGIEHSVVRDGKLKLDRYRFCPENVIDKPIRASDTEVIGNVYQNLDLLK